MTEAVDVPEGLAAMPPGPALATLLAGIDPARVANNELLTVLRAQSRQAAHEQARLLSMIAEVGRATPRFNDREVLRLPHPHQYGADEIRAALAWSRRAADRESDLAEQVVHELPLVHAAFLAGGIDKAKVQVFSDHLIALTAAQVHAICAAVVPLAGRLTTGQITTRLRKLIAAIDPDHYDRRYRKGLRDRRVMGYLADDGTATITTSGLTPAEAAAALERIDNLALAARRAGHPSTLDQIRVDILIGLLDGTLHHLDREAMIAHLITHRSANDDPVDARPHPAATATPGASHEPPADSQPHGRSSANGSHPDPDTTDPSTTDPSTTDPSTTSPSTTSPTTTGRDAPAGFGDQRVGVEVRVELSTLLGLDEHPGEIPGWGPITSRHARDTVSRQTRAEWRFAITDHAGRLVFDGLTRRRPSGMDSAGPRGGVVELQIPATLLASLAEDNSGDWAAVVADMSEQYSRRATRDLDAYPTERLPRAALRRHVQIRDRGCVGPGCRRAARKCDQDHTVGHRHGGPTTAADLGPLCRHDHMVKHDGGWDLGQPEPGVFVWTSPLGGVYWVRPEPLLPQLPDPEIGKDNPWYDEPADDDQPLRLRAPCRPSPRPTPPPSAADPDEKPPF